MLKQAVERISRVREAALRHLRALLNLPLVRPLVPAADALDACLPHQVFGGSPMGMYSTRCITVHE